ncbi:MAG: methyltransferase domain-containing protein [Pseudomonadota bacterium]
MFRSAGTPPRVEAQCWSCGGLERHRFFALEAERFLATSAEGPSRVLHVAPEECLENIVLGAANHCVQIDLLRDDVDLNADLTRLPFPNETFDAIICNHVLEHVANDKAALKECKRVLKSTGTAILSVPVKGELTFEDASITSEEDRIHYFGQKDHVRQYGEDFGARLESLDFEVDKKTADDAFTQSEVLRFGLGPGTGSYYLARKRLSA